MIRVQVDKEGEAGAQRKVTRAIKFLCHSEESLRLEMSVLKTGFKLTCFHIFYNPMIIVSVANKKTKKMKPCIVQGCNRRATSEIFGQSTVWKESSQSSWSSSSVGGFYANFV